VKRVSIFIYFSSLMLATGCNSVASDQDDVAPKMKEVTFQGEVDPKFVGNWKTEKETSGLDLHKDGTAVIASAVPSPKGIVKSSLNGSWRVANGELYIQYTDRQHVVTTIKYPAKLSGPKMTLDQGSGSHMIYSRR